MAPNDGSSGRAAASEPPVDKGLKRYLAFASKLAADARGRLRSFAAMPSSLTLRLLSSVLLFSACVTLILTALQLYLEYRHDVSALELRLDQISKSNLDSLAERLWALDENQLQLQLTGILQLPDIHAVEVREAGTAGDPLVIMLGEKTASSAITREYPLLYNVQGQNTRIGTLYVQATLANIYHELFHTASIIFVRQAAQIFLVSLFIVYIFHNLVTRHLFAIATFVDSYRINDPPSPLRLQRPPRRHEDELQRVATAFNALSDNLQGAYRSLREREARIRRLIDAGIIGVFLFDIEGPIFEANDAFLRMVGYDREDLVSGGLRWTDLTPPEWRERDARQWVPELKATGRLEPFEKEYFRKGGSRVPVLIGTATFEESPNQGVAFVLDLTERKQAEQTRQELEEQWRASFESNPTMYFIVNAAGEIVSVNAFGAEQLGYTVSELVGQPVSSVFYEPDRNRVRKHTKECFEQPGRIGRWEARKIHKDGTMLWVRETANAVVLKKRPVLLVACENITEQKRAEEAVRRSEKELRDVISTIPTMAWTALPDGTNDFANQSWLDYTGISLKDASGSGWKAAFHPADIATHVARWRASLAAGKPLENEARLKRASDGEYRWFLHRGVPLRDENGNILKWYGIATDIDDRKRAEPLLTGEKRILEMVAKGDSLALILESLCRLVEEQDSGVLASILLLDGNRLRHGGAPSLPKAYTDAIDGVVIGPSVGSCGTAAYRKEQVIVEDIATDPLWAEYREVALPHSLRACWSTPVFSSQGKVMATFAMYYREPRSPSPRDQEIIEQITHLAGVAIERKLTQEALSRSESYLAEAQRLSHTGSWARNMLTGENTHSSDEHSRLFGFDPALGLPSFEAFSQRIHPDDRAKVSEAFDKAIRERTDFEVDFRTVQPDNTIKYLHGVGHPVFGAGGGLVEYVGTAVDISERKRAEAEREKLQQLETDLARINRVSIMGELAASLAHEIKQPIAAAATNAKTSLRWLQREPPDTGEAREALSRIVKDVSRAADMIDRTRSLYRRDTPKREMVDVNEMIREMIALLRDAANRQSVSIRAELDGALPTMTADRVQIQQVLMNLMLNGIEAMKDAGGEMTIRSKTTEDGQLLLTVSDLGVGLPVENAERIFDAFFTTKAQGTGMGLCICRRIIESHGGRLWASANPARGATFQFILRTAPAQSLPSGEA
jgi:PAS domain S-box-containing protein